MNAIQDLSYDIEQLFIEGHSAKQIADLLDCTISTVLDWYRQSGLSLEEDEPLSPYATSGS